MIVVVTSTASTSFNLMMMAFIYIYIQAISTFSPVGSLSSNGLRMRVCMCLWHWHSTEWTYMLICQGSAYFKFIPYTHTHSHTIWGLRTDGAKSGHCIYIYIYIYILLFSTLEQTHCAFVICDSNQVTVAYTAVWFLRGWCHLKLLPSLMY